MKVMQLLKVSLVVLFLFSGLFGCASKQAATMADDQAKLGQTDMSQQATAAQGADDKSMQGEKIMSHDQMAGMGTIFFDFDQFTLSAEARSTLGNNAKYLSANSAVQVVIEGHCDERGSDEYNLALGESRALAAKNYLVSSGVSASRLSVISYGEEKPMNKGADEAAWAQNRRAEFKAVR